MVGFAKKHGLEITGSVAQQCGAVKLITAFVFSCLNFLIYFNQGYLYIHFNFKNTVLKDCF